LLKTLAEHDDLDTIWSFTDEASAAAAKALSIGNLKQVFTNEGRAIDWFDAKQGEGRWFRSAGEQYDRRQHELMSGTSKCVAAPCGRPARISHKC
jgi:predicted RNA-binding Zn ribbon-like protein